MLFLFSRAFAQVSLPFPIYNPMNPGQNLPQSFDLGDPTSIQQSVVYDPESGNFILTETIGNGLFFRYPSMMSIEEYLAFQERKSQTLDWQEIIEEETAENRQFELPIKVGSKVFEGDRGVQLQCLVIGDAPLYHGSHDLPSCQKRHVGLI